MSLEEQTQYQGSKQQRYFVKTLGCKANLYDSQLIEAELARKGWLPTDEEHGADLVVVNGCTVTDEADRQSRRAATQLGKQNAAARVVFTGCGAEVDPELAAKTPGVHYVVGNQDKHRIVDLVLDAAATATSSLTSANVTGSVSAKILGSLVPYGEILSRHPIDREWPEPQGVFKALPTSAQGESARTRAFIKIQEGCNSFCTFCIIPYGRGPSRSLSIPEVVTQVRELVTEGAREVVITGTNIGDYGVERVGDPMRLTELARAILGKTGLERLRLSSLDPTEITPDLIELMSRDVRLLPHFHVSLQSPHTRVLKLMKRKYAFEQLEECLQRIAEIPAPEGGVFVGMDVITGFPGEGSAEFDWTVEALERLPWSRLHVFPYSEREGTPATRLPGSVPQAERVRRSKVLRDLSLARMKSIHEAVLSRAREHKRPLRGVLLESEVKGPDGTRDWIAGYSPNYLRVLARKSDVSVGANEIVDVMPESLLADPASGDVVLLGRFSGTALSKSFLLGSDPASCTV